MTTSFKHGTVNGYNYHKCDCYLCKGANRKRMADLRAKRYAEPKHPDDPRHGTVSFYSNHGCRCARCTETYSIRNREYRSRKKP